MRALVVSDIHSNLEALRGVIDDAERHGGFDRVWSLGDLVGYGPDPGPCVDLVREYQTTGVAGNHDLAAVGKLSLEAFNRHAADANRWTSTQLDDEQTAYLRELPLKVETEDFTIVHGSPRDPIWEYVISTSAAAAGFLHFDTARCLVGHSHVPFLCQPQESGVEFRPFPVDAPVALRTDRLIINPGSVGQPRDGDAMASYALYDGDDGTISHRRVEYDIPATQQKMRDRGLPQFLVDRLAEGR